MSISRVYNPWAVDRFRLLLVLGALNVALHLLGLALAALGMRPGTGVFPLPERMAYVAPRPAGWVLGWATWALCALVLVGFVAALTARARSAADSSVRALALALAAAGAAVDLCCDVLWITVVPDLAARGEVALFLAVERMLGAAGAAVANGLYSVAVLLVALTLREGRPLGYATFAFGMLMVAAAFTGDPRHLEWVTGPTIGAFLAWTVAVLRAERARP